MNSTPIDTVLSRLKGVKKTTNGWDALCPAHDDSKPSLGVAATEDGTVLLKCRSQSCSADAICKAMGLNLADLFPARDRNGASGSMNIVATSDYMDAVESCSIKWFVSTRRTSGKDAPTLKERMAGHGT